MVPADDQAIVFPCASVIVIMVLLNVAFTCATPEAIFLRSRRRTRVASLPILHPLAGIFPQLGPAVVTAVAWPEFLADTGPVVPQPSAPVASTRTAAHTALRTYFFLPAIGLAGPLRLPAFVWVRWPRMRIPRRCLKHRYHPRSISRALCNHAS